MYNDSCRLVKVQVLRAPGGVLPDWVREAWIGVTVPAQTDARPGTDTPGYLASSGGAGLTVRVADAVAALHEYGRHSAADWLSDTALMRPSGVRTFVLDDDDAVVVPHEFAAVEISAPTAEADPLPF